MLNNYSKQELIQIIKYYNQYIQDWFNANEDLQTGQEPVCVYYRRRGVSLFFSSPLGLVYETFVL